MIEKYLIERGWALASNGCRACGSPPKYSHEGYPDYRIAVWRSRDKCAVFKNNLRCVPYDVGGDELEKVLGEIGIKII